ncbi:MAG TPA: hypothetical protein VLL48_14015, partial [Longimicrobiales bacterium]|nr:hypothetical protein [Longimicrobiales bacterium]
MEGEVPEEPVDAPGTAPAPPWVVHKFGGTSLSDASRYERAAELVRSGAPGPVAVVVSAPAGVTDALLEAVRRAAAREPDYRRTLAEVRDRIAAIAEPLLGDGAPSLLERLDADVGDLTDVLRGVELTRSAPAQTAELVAGFGELWSARMLHAHLAATEGADARWLDAREVLVVRRGETGPVVVWDESSRRLDARLAGETPRWLVITGFVASDEEDVATSLGRNGSDHSASIFARLL